MDLADYNSIVFDCDGVILDSNKTKSQSFYSVAFAYNEESASELYSYHVSNGGISRYVKFQYYIDYILPKYRGRLKKDFPSLQCLLTKYSDLTFEGLMNCQMASSLDLLREQTRDSRWMIASGGDQEELRNVFKKRQIDKYFDMGIFGSPAKKMDILQSSIEKNLIMLPAIMIGDSKYDFLSAESAGLDFLFVSDWTELDDWQSFLVDNNLPSIGSLSQLVV